MQTLLEDRLIPFLFGFLAAELLLAWRLRRHRPPIRVIPPLVTAEGDRLAAETSRRQLAQTGDPEVSDAD